MMTSLVLILAVLFGDGEMESSVRVNPKTPSSGTIIKVIDRDAYILSTGHMKTREDIIVQVFYMDGVRLEKPANLQGTIVFLVENNEKGADFSIIKVELPERKSVSYTPLAAKGVKLRKDQTYRAIGCGMGSEPKDYQVVFLKEWKGSLVTAKEPAPGASGGGLFRAGKLLGVCWGSYYQGKELY